MAKFNLNYLLTTKSVAVSYDGKHYMVTKSAEPKRYEKLRNAIVAKDEKAFIDALIPKTRVIRYSNEYFEIDKENKVYMKDRLDEPLPDVIAQRLVEFSDEDMPIEPIVHFWKKLRKNPSENSKEMLYGFLEVNHHPITPDGNFIAYKKVSEKDGKLVDTHTRKIDNSIGKIVSMPRNQVVEDKYQTCSSGLHVAAWDYAQSFGGSVLVEVLVDPGDVVSVPIDYNQQKMRVCRYKVSCEIERDKPHSANVVSKKDESGLDHKADVSSAIDGNTVSLVALTAKEIIQVAKKILASFHVTELEGMNTKNKKSIVKKAKKYMEKAGYTVIVDTPKKRK